MDSSVANANTTALSNSLPQEITVVALNEKMGHDLETARTTIASPDTHWGRRIRHVLFLLSLGISSTNRLQEITAPGREADWKDFMTALLTRVGNINVVSSLILATDAAFLTTSPSTSIADWLQPMPYVILLATFCLAFLAVGCGTFLQFVLMDAQAKSLRELSHHPRAAGAGGIVALCGAVWYGDNAFAKAGLTLTVAGTVGAVLGFVATVI
ncbi:hypothetical protein AcW2_004999 [Taiwanofungus camphoratus]|nr:hypothetical protein AcW2_004999 [Antrodia cinnamomea]